MGIVYVKAGVVAHSRIFCPKVGDKNFLRLVIRVWISVGCIGKKRQNTDTVIMTALAKTSSRVSSTPRDAEEWVKHLKALADTTRLRIIGVLLGGSLSVNDIARRLRLSQFNVSKHLRVLREAEIVEMEPIANRREYSIAAGLRSRVSSTNTLELGCCTLRFDHLLAPRKSRARPRT